VTPKTTTLSDSDLRAVGTLIEGHPDRIAAIAASLQQSGRVLESRVRGTSMADALPEGAAVRIALCRAQGYRRGEVVAFLVGARLTVHRVVVARCWPRRTALVTRGDARVFADPPLRADQVLGRVVAVRTTTAAWTPVPAPTPLTRTRGLVAAIATAVAAALASAFGARVAHGLAKVAYRLLLRARPACSATGG
jgi:hypothetical protein